MKLSIVTTLYMSENYIEEFYERVSKTAKELFNDDFEIIFVNDGSPDNSLEIAVKLSEKDSKIVVVDLSRNFGHHKAMMEGLNQSKGEYIFLIDCDLEEDPEYLLEFYTDLNSENSDVIYGIQDKRKGNWFERWSGELYYSLFNSLTNVKHPRNLVTMRIMTRRYVDSLLKFKEHEMVISGLWILTGFEQKGKIIQKHTRDGSTYSFSRKISHLFNAVTSYSTAPLWGIFYLGIVIFVISLIYSLIIVYQRLFLKIPTDGWTSLIVSIWMLSGLIILFLGIIGIYLSKIFIETKQRPNSIIRNIYGR